MDADGWLGKTRNIPSIAKIGLLSTTAQSTKGMQYARTPDTVRNFMTDLINEGSSLARYVRRIYIPACFTALHFPSIIEFSRTRGGLDFRPESRSQGILFVSLHRISSFVRRSECQLQKLPEITIDRVSSDVKCVEMHHYAPHGAQV